MGDIFKYLPYAYRAIQQRASIGLLQEDLLAVYEAAKPAIAEIQRRWPEMHSIGISLLATIFPDLRPQLIGSGGVLWTPSTLWVQRDLQERGFYKGALDGKYGPATVEAVTKFQRSAGFAEEDIDGLAGIKTIGAMLAQPKTLV